jgi:hypothetical protein
VIHRPWTALDDLLPRLANSLLPRSPGVHLSQCYGRLYPPKKRAIPLTERELQLFAIGGFAVERVIELGLIHLMVDHCPEVERPGELVSPSTGIVGSPDLFFYEPDESAPGGKNIRVGDIKCKWSSARKLPVHEEGEDEFPPEWAKVFSQNKGYLYMLSEHYQHQFTSGRILAYFVNDDYRPPQPQLYGWDLEYSWQEIAELSNIATETEPESHGSR